MNLPNSARNCHEKIERVCNWVLLSACGGGSGAPPSTIGAAAPPPPVSASTSGMAALVAMPAAPASAVKISSGAVNQGGSAQDWDISFRDAVNLTVSGQLNKLWISAATSGGTAAISGDSNTIVFRPGTQTAVAVSGRGNIFYLVEGSPIKIEGPGAVSSTVNYYKP
jgi:hypothetical protein